MFTTFSKLSAAFRDGMPSGGVRFAWSDPPSASARLALAGKIMTHVPRIMSIMDIVPPSTLTEHRHGERPTRAASATRLRRRLRHTRRPSSTPTTLPQ